jgi:hypothetical protein
MPCLHETPPHTQPTKKPTLLLKKGDLHLGGRGQVTPTEKRVMSDSNRANRAKAIGLTYRGSHSIDYKL